MLASLVGQMVKKVKVLVTQLCLTLCDPMHCSPSDSSVHGILQARILEWAIICFSRGSSWPRDQTQVSCFAGRFFTNWTIRESQVAYWVVLFISSFLKNSLEKGMSTHSSIPAWRIPWREELGSLQSRSSSFLRSRSLW